MTMRQPHSSKRIPVSIAVTVLALFSVFGAQAASSKDTAEVEQMTDLLVEMLPFGHIFEMAAKADPKWPMQEKPGAIKPEKLSCLRGELSTDGYRRMKMAEVKAYAETNTSRMKSDLELLSNGASLLFGKLMMAGVESERSGTQVDPADIMKQATPEQMMSFVTFFSDPNYTGLRKLAGIGDALGMNKSVGENESAGEQLGASLATQAMLKAMTNCDVPMSVLFE
jgi:hypothetical protein